MLYAYSIYIYMFFRVYINIYIYTYRERESKCVLCAWRPFHLQTIDVLGPLSQNIAFELFPVSVLTTYMGKKVIKLSSF